MTTRSVGTGEQVVSIIYRCKDGLRHTVCVPAESVQVCNKGETIVIDTSEEPIAIRRVKIEEV